jgi:transposase-like protein
VVYYETYVKVGGSWRYVYRAVDQAGQVIDIYVSRRRNTEAARRFFDRALADHKRPVEVVTDKAQPLLAAVDHVLPDALPITDRYANNRVDADHGRLKARLQPMRHLRCDRTAAVVIRARPSSRTSDAATTNWASTSAPSTSGWRRLSTSWPT